MSKHMMTKNDLMRCEKSRDFVKGIESLGYEPKKNNGSSHYIYQCEGRPTISIVNHGNGDLAIGTRRNILNLIFGCNPGQNK
jgi:predicted RNA binding protein YcfA (HicA-like mRNA interferase family)